MDTLITTEYKNWINKLKQKFQSAQIKASIRVNSTLLEFYWELGNDIVQKQKEYKWGSGFLKQLSDDLNKEFPNVKGFSKRNLEHIRRWVLFYSKDKTDSSAITKQVVSQLENQKSQQAVDQLVKVPWGHNIVIVQKCKNIDEALFYVENTIK
jgi:predicted nuclease of restriction endonuclease-like (RecB) superfamily